MFLQLRSRKGRLEGMHAAGVEFMVLYDDPRNAVGSVKTVRFTNGESDFHNCP